MEGDSTALQLGLHLFEEDIDNILMQTNQFVTSGAGTQAPFWWIIQLSMALGALFAIITCAYMAYKMMLKKEPLDVLKLCKPLAISIVLCFWYPPQDTQMHRSGVRGSILDILAYVPNALGSYTHDVYESEEVQLQDKISELEMYMIQLQDTTASSAAERDAVKTGVQGSAMEEIVQSFSSASSIFSSSQTSSKEWIKSISASVVIGFDKLLMFISFVLFRISWWGTILCQQIFLGALTIFGPIQWAFSLLPKWEGAWAKWTMRYLTTHLWGVMLYFVGFYVLLLFDIAISVQIDSLSALINNGGVQSYLQNAFLTSGYMICASLVAMKCLSMVPDLASWILPEGEAAFAARGFGTGVSDQIHAKITRFTGI